MKFDLQQKTVVITGVTGGLGRAMTNRLIEHFGCRVIGVGRNARRLQQMQAAFEQNRFFPVCMDVTNQTHWVAFANRLGNDLPQADLLINNVGMLPPFCCFSQTPSAVAAQTMEVDYLAAVLATRALLSMLKQRSGAILNNCSSGALCALPGTSTYASAKGAMKNWSECLMEELRGQVLVCTAFPGFTKTDIFRNQTGKADPALLNLVATPAPVMARRLLRGLSVGRRRQVRGADARLMYLFTTLFPVWSLDVYAFVMKKSGMSLFSRCFDPEDANLSPDAGIHDPLINCTNQES